MSGRWERISVLGRLLKADDCILKNRKRRWCNFFCSANSYNTHQTMKSQQTICVDNVVFFSQSIMKMREFWGSRDDNVSRLVNQTLWCWLKYFRNSWMDFSQIFMITSRWNLMMLMLLLRFPLCATMKLTFKMSNKIIQQHLTMQCGSHIPVPLRMMIWRWLFIWRHQLVKISEFITFVFYRKTCKTNDISTSLSCTSWFVLFSKC